jgi:alpha-mannosidase/mannosylglycerate hydrolase
VHAAPATFPHQGWVCANDLTVIAPGLPEAEVVPDGTIAITVLRAVGWLARFDLTSRPLPAGPEMPVPGAQLHGKLEAKLSLLDSLDPDPARAAELGLRAVIAGDTPLLAQGRSLLTVQPSTLLVSALKPAARGAGIVLRVLNPTDTSVEATLVVGLPIVAAAPVRLDEEPDTWPLHRDGGTLRFTVPPHALRSICLATPVRAGPQYRA